MTNKGVWGIYNKSVQVLDENESVYKTGIIPIEGKMYQIGAYQYFLSWDNDKIVVTESSTGFKVSTYKRLECETNKQFEKRVLRNINNFGPSLADWEKVKSIMKKEGIPYPANKWVSNLKDIKS